MTVYSVSGERGVVTVTAVLSDALHEAQNAKKHMVYVLIEEWNAMTGERLGIYSFDEWASLLRGD